MAQSGYFGDHSPGVPPVAVDLGNFFTFVINWLLWYNRSLSESIARSQMRKRRCFGIILAVFIIVCQCRCNKTDAELQRFAAEYEALKNTYRQRLNKPGTAEEHASLLTQKSQDMEVLLKKYEKTSVSDAAELLKSKILIEIAKFHEANRKIDGLITRKSNFRLAAQRLKVYALVGMGDTAKALRLFKEIEPSLAENDRDDRFMGWLYLAFYSEDVKEREAYSGKFLESPDLPGNLTGYKADLYWNLAAIAKEEADLERAGEMLQKAISLTREEKMKLAWESELAQLKWIGKSALPCFAENWLNSPPLSLESLQGKVVVIVFWAPWCSACGEVFGGLADQYRQYSDKDLVVIGYTKLYGTYRDETEKTETIPLEQEVALLGRYIKRRELIFPMAISYEGYLFEDYNITVIPTMIFIDKQGNIADIILGAANPQRIGNKIKKLLEATNGKD
jgi:tetratricopeptide (TPR) repeat protein